MAGKIVTLTGNVLHGENGGFRAVADKGVDKGDINTAHSDIIVIVNVNVNDIAGSVVVENSGRGHR